jgi:hypothetical protein
MNSSTPKGGDFVAQLERRQATQPSASRSPSDEVQSIEDVLIHGEEPTDGLIEEMKVLNDAPVSDEELARQALEHPGADGDPRTPE